VFTKSSILHLIAPAVYVATEVWWIVAQHSSHEYFVSVYGTLMLVNLIALIFSLYSTLRLFRGRTLAQNRVPFVVNLLVVISYPLKIGVTAVVQSLTNR
jgi:uncharacterized membrane protein